MDGVTATHLKYDDNVEQDNFVAFELEDHILVEVLANKGTVELRGAPQDKAVLVTADATYTVRLVESSNTMALVLPQDPESIEETSTAASADDTEQASPSKRQKTAEKTTKVTTRRCTAHMVSSESPPAPAYLPCTHANVFRTGA